MLSNIKKQLNLVADEEHFLWVDSDIDNRLWNIRLNELIDRREIEPVYLVSYEAKKDFMLSNPDMLIINSPYVYWIQIPADEAQFNVRLDKYTQEIIISYLKKIKQSRLNYIEKILKHELANEFSPLIMASYCFDNGIADQKTYDVVKDKFEQRKNSNLNKLLKQYYYLTNLSNIKKTNDNVHKKDFKRYQLKVLLIDDFADNGFYDVFKLMFKKLDYFNNDIDAEKYLSKIEDNYIPYDLIICDLNLRNESADIDIKERSGYKIIKTIKEKDFFVPVILFTSSEKTQNYIELKNLGLEAYVNKLHADSKHDEIEYTMQNLFRSLDKISKNTFVHRFYYAYSLYNNLELSNLKIRDKLYAILLKLYNSAFYFNTYHKRLNNLIYNEILLYVHNIITDIIQETDATCCFEKNNISIFFKNTYEQNILTKLNSLRNSINLIHGSSRVDLEHIISYLNLVFFLLLRKDREKLDIHKGNVIEMLKTVDQQRIEVRDLKRLWQISD